jgi:hypothetical protein
MELTALATPCRAPTRDFAGSDAHGKVIIASRWRAFSTGLFFTAYMGIFESNTKGMFLILSFEYKLFFQSTTVMICQKTVSLFYEKMKLLYLV